MALHLNSPGGGTSQFALWNHSCTLILWTTPDSSDRAKDPGPSDQDQADGAYWFLYSIPGLFRAPREWGGRGGGGYYYDLWVIYIQKTRNACARTRAHLFLVPLRAPSFPNGL